MTDVNSANLLNDTWDYPLFEALYGRRSRRFGLGFEIAEGPFRYRSEQPPVPLSEFEEALLVAAGIGVTGIPLWDGSRPPAYRGGDGRTFASTAHGRRTALFFDTVVARMSRKDPSATSPPPNRPAAHMMEDAEFRDGMFEVSDEGVACAKTVCNYIYETYGRFPASVDAMHLTWFMQAHHLDLDYYAKFFRPGACGRTQEHHMRIWHPGVCE